MIDGLFETHIPVVSLDASMHFYEQVLGLELGRFEEDRRVAFYWIGKRGEAMLGLWEKPRHQVIPQHYAFRSSLQAITERAVPFPEHRGLAHYNFLKQGTGEPMVFGWMPAVSIYFRDPDNHELELIAMLPGPPRPEIGVVSYAHRKELSGLADP